MPDFDHLSPTGFLLWAEAIEPVVKDLLREEYGGSNSALP
jgi:hypothetical protein